LPHRCRKTGGFFKKILNWKDKRKP
jgi:hypothetical protein